MVENAASRRRSGARGGGIAGVLAAAILSTLAFAQAQESRLPGETFRDCEDCTELVIVPNGEFTMGSNDKPSEAPPHRVVIHKAFAIGRRLITFSEWGRCVAAGGCKYSPPDPGQGGADLPVTNLSWDDAQEFVAWMSHTYRKSLSTAERSGVGVCSARRLDDALLVGQGYRKGTRPVFRMRGPRDGQDDARRLLPAECFWSLRHLRRRGRVGVGLLEPKLQGRSGGRLVLDERRLLAASAAWRIFCGQGRGASFVGALPIRRRRSVLCERLPRGARVELMAWHELRRSRRLKLTCF